MAMPTSMDTTSPTDIFPASPIVKEGLLYKRGETIKNWRPRYFYLLADGSLKGFKAKPENPYDTNPLNDFTVRDCQIMKMDRPKPFTFAIRGSQSQWSRVIERTFYTTSEHDRHDWLSSIERVADSLKMSNHVPFQLQSPNMNGNGENENENIEIMAVESYEGPSIDADLCNKFALQGTSCDKLSGKKKVTFENFEFLKLLGKGAFGKVILCREKSSRKLYAVKILRKEVVIKKKEVTHTLAENRILQTTNHPFIISLKCSFQTNDRLCFVTEYANGGELFFHLSKGNMVFSEDRGRFYAAEIISAIGYLHQNGIIYRDLKLENLLLDKDGHIKLADFGLCKEDMTYGSTTKTFCGTPEYFAPEVIMRTGYGLAVDWWGIGILMYEMMVGALPFSDRDYNYSRLFKQIVHQEVCFPPFLSVEAKDLLSRLLRKDPHERLGGGTEDVKEVMQHVFFSCINWEDLVQKKIPPPFKPQVTSETDTRYFDSMFTRAPVELTPPNNDGQLRSMLEGNAMNFEGFSYKDLSATPGGSLRTGTLF